MNGEKRREDLASPSSPIDTNGAEIRCVLDLDSCRFERFPFDRLLPRIERDRIVLPGDEPGVRPYAEWRPADGIELPVRHDGMTLGRFVLVPASPTCGVAFGAEARALAREIAADTGSWIALRWALDASARGGR